MSQCFLKAYEPPGGDIIIKLDLYNFATKADLKNATRIDTSKLVAKFDLVSLKTEVNKIEVERLKTISADLSKLSKVVKNEVVKKTVYDKLVAKVNNIDTSRKTSSFIDTSSLFEKLNMTRTNQNQK